MLEKSFEKLYLMFRANYYKSMVENIGTRPGSLTATESFCVEIIYLLHEPTISQFAKFLNISVPNANYKIGSLVEKNYVVKVPSTQDKREFHLHVTDKFLSYYGLKDTSIAGLMSRIQETMTPDEITQVNNWIDRLIDLMEEEHPQ